MIRTIDIAWLGGLLEGEGHFALSGKCPGITLVMCDEDTVIKVADMWNTRIHHRKNYWKTYVYGMHAVSWMMTLYPFLGKRRRSAVREVVKFWREYNHLRAPRGTRFMAACHPDEIRYGFGLCKTCWQRQYRKQKQLLKKVG